MTNKSESIFLNEITGTCEICHKNTAKYRCPNCGVIYCSIGCFKNHNNQCVSKFSNQLIKDYPPPKVSNETKLKTRKLLAQYDETKIENNFDSHFNNNENAGVNPKTKIMTDSTNGDAIFENENYSTKHFQLQTEVEPWEAWWEKKVIANFPEPTTKPPIQFSDCLIYHLTDILYSYCYTMRLYNGDATFDFEGACNVMVSISSVLGLNVGEISSVRFALNQCINNAKDPEIFVEFQWLVEVVYDVELCLQSKSHVYRALSEAHSIAKEAKFKKVFKKLEFFFAWSQILTMKMLEKLSEEVHDYYTSLQALLFDVRE